MIIPRTLNQKEYLQLLDSNLLPILLINGPKSAGKRFLALSEGFRQLKNNNFNKLYVTYPHVTIENENESFVDKSEIIRSKTIEYLKEFDSNIISSISEKKVIVDTIPLIYGKCIRNSFVVGLNMSESTPIEMSLLLNNYDKNSKIVVIGDNKREISFNGLSDIIHRVSNDPTVNYIKHFDFNKTSDDVIFHGVSFELFKLYSNTFKKKGRFNIKYDEM